MAQFSGLIVYPNLLELDFSKSEGKFISKVIQVENTSNKPYRVRAYLESWDLDKYGSIVFLDKPTVNSLDSYTKFNPKEFDLAPGQKQTVRLTAKLPDAAEGEFKSIIFFETVSQKQDLLQPSSNKVNINVTFKTRYGVALYAYKGKISRNALLQGLSYEKTKNTQYIAATLKNEGNIHCNVEGTLTLIPSSGSNAISIPVTRYTILPKVTQKYRIQLPNIPLNENSFNAVLKLNYKDTDGKIQVLEGQTNFDYKMSKNSIKKDLINTSSEENIQKTPENIVKPIVNEVKLK